MARLENERIAAAKANGNGLIQYLQAIGEPLQRVGQNEYTLKDMDSIRINPEKNCWIRNSNDQKGNVVEFLVQFEGLSFRDAVVALTPTWTEQENENINARVARAINRPQAVPPQKNEFKQENEIYTLSDKAPNAIAYLTKTRKISPETVFKLLNQGKLAQDTRGNAVFRITDEHGNWKGAEIVGTNTQKPFKRSTQETGYGWSMHIGKPKVLCVFECAIDAISFYELHKSTIKDVALVSIAGVTKDYTFTESVKRYAEQFGINNSNVCLCVDKDKAGDNFILKYKPVIGCKSYRTPEPYKDWNEMLQSGIREINLPSKKNDIRSSDNGRQKEKVEVSYER